MLDKEAQTLFNEWFDRGIERPESWRDGDAFSDLYRALNVAMAHLSGKRRDRDMLNWLKNNESVISEAFNRRLNYEPFTQKLNVLKDMCPINDGRTGKVAADIKDISDMGQVLEALYKIRCNFFHGNKPVTVDRNQRFFDVGSHILKYWLEVVRTKSAD